MKNKLKDSITIKILFAMCICIVSFTLVSSLVISALLGSRLSERARQTNEQYLITIRNQLNGYIGELNTPGSPVRKQPEYHTGARLPYSE